MTELDTARRVHEATPDPGAERERVLADAATWARSASVG